MKWIAGYTWMERWERKRKNLEKWHIWFAWIPVVVGFTHDKKRIKMWLEKVDRRGKLVGDRDNRWVWEYRKLGLDESELEGK